MIIIAGCDIETTGLKQEEGHRIVEIAIPIYASKDGKTFNKVGKTLTQRINPMRSIDAMAESVHGISLADLKGCPEWEEVAPRISKILDKADLFVAHNAEFDAPFVALELVRVGLPMPKFDVFCTMKNGRACTALGKAPSLQELAWACGYEYDEGTAHAADYDIELTMDCFFFGLKKGWFKPEILQEKAEEKAA